MGSRVGCKIAPVRFGSDEIAWMFWNRFGLVLVWFGSDGINWVLSSRSGLVPGCAGAMIDAALEEIAPRLMKKSFGG